MNPSRLKNSISVFLPVYNDQATIAGLVQDALSVLPSFTDDYEVILVDDGLATGATMHAAIKALQQQQPGRSEGPQAASS